MSNGNIIIVGFMGSGKGAAAKATARKLQFASADLDKMVSERMKMTSAEIYERFGEAYYRAMETNLLDEMAGAQISRTVLVLGSGAVLMPQNLDYLKQLGNVYYICMKPTALLEKMKEKDSRHAWIRSDAWDEQVMKIYREREPSYKKAADTIIEADGLTTEEIADRIISVEAAKE